MAAMTQTKTNVIGVFEDYEMAQRAIEDLRRAGFREEQIGLVARDEPTLGRAPPENITAAEEGALTGALAGASIGGLWGIGIVAGLLPAVGPIIAGGTLAAVLASAVGSAAVGGLIGSLIGLGIPEEEARFYEMEFHSGRAIVTVRAEDHFQEAWDILKQYGAYDIHSANGGNGRDQA